MTSPALAHVPLGSSGLTVSSLCLGGNVFGWTADEAASFAVLDAFAEAGGTFVDTADVYSAWVPGHSGGESEAVLGRWMTARGNRDEIVVATKVGSLPTSAGLSAQNLAAACEASLERLQTDRIDLYYSHRDDESTPQEETAGGFDALVQAGKVRALGASNFSAERLRSALAASSGMASYTVVQPLYNLLERDYESELAPVVEEAGLACLPYSSLASGFLSGKYRPGTTVEGPRAPKASQYLEQSRGRAVLAVLDDLAAAHGVTLSAVALAWLAAQDTVVSPLASARSVEQLTDLLPYASLELTADDLARLRAAA